MIIKNSLNTFVSNNIQKEKILKKDGKKKVTPIMENCHFQSQNSSMGNQNCPFFFHFGLIIMLN